MGKINWNRVLLGGLLAGVVANVLAFGSWYLFLRTGWKAEVAQLARPIQETVGFNVFWLLFYFVVGITATWWYAAVRPRFGPGAKTATIAGFAYCHHAYFLLSVAWRSLITLSTGLLAEDAVVNFAVIVVATLVGGWGYRE